MIKTTKLRDRIESFPKYFSAFKINKNRNRNNNEVCFLLKRKKDSQGQAKPWEGEERNPFLLSPLFGIYELRVTMCF